MTTHDLAAASFTQTSTYDICVVGAGAAGILLTIKLLRGGKSVLLVESGGLNFEQPTQDLYRSEVHGHAHTGVHEGRFRTWGGTTTRWGGQILPLEPIDFAHRPWIPGSGWPITLDELRPFYAEALELEGLTTAILNDAQVWQAAGAPIPTLGPDLEPYFTRWLQQPNFARLHGAELERAPRLTALLHANITGADSSDGIVTALHCTSLNGNTATITACEFVLAIGSIETSRLLLHFEEQQGAEDGKQWNPNNLVGRGFHDHIDVEPVTIQPIDRKRFFAAFTNVLLRGFKYHPKFRLTPAQQQANGILNVAGTITFRDDTSETADAMKATGKRILRRAFHEVDTAQLLHLVRNLPLLVRQAWSYAIKHRVYNSPSAQIALRVHCEQQPNSASIVTLSGERDPLGMRRTRLHWVISNLELDTIRAFLRITAEALRTQNLATVTPTIDLDNDEALRAACDDGLHHMGGAIMSANPLQGVVDPDLRLRGFSNFSICSAAVFPTGGFSNPTHTVLALAMRLAHRLTSQAAQ
jgi:choline dehydrogenase-like flavoprotein